MLTLRSTRGEKKKRCKEFVDLFTGRDAEHGQRAGVTLSSLCGAASAGGQPDMTDIRSAGSGRRPELHSIMNVVISVTPCLTASLQ